MENQKLENLLNLALEVSPKERARSFELETGYLPEQESWELIVKYSGSLEEVGKMGIQVEEMANEYAILTVPESLIEPISALPQIEYVEKPKRLFFAVNQAKAASCINLLQEPDFGLTGRGVLVAVLDSGIDYLHPDFQTEEGTTRIAALWDQTLGKIFYPEEINQAIHAGDRAQARKIVPSVDVSGHGTAVAGILAGGGRGEGGAAYRGIAYESQLLVVKLGTGKADGFPRTTELMRAVNFVVEKAVELERPLIVNISFGNTYGSHDGTSLLETFLNDISNFGRTTILVGSGNEGAAAGHVSGVLKNSGGGILRARDGNFIREELSVADYETGFSVQLWKSYTDQFSIRLLTPSGEILGPLAEQLGPLRYRYRQTTVLIYYGKPGPYSQAQEIYFDFLPDEGRFVESGIWTFLLEPDQVVEGRYDFWLPAVGILNSGTGFLRSTPDTTLTIPSTAANVITVGAYDSAARSYADFSGRGFTRRTNQVKPDLAAPGVGLMAPARGGGYQPVTGTSFASPVAAGSAALMVQWGIVNGNDPFLYGEKVKAYFHRGARPLPGMIVYPNPMVGYGTLCLRDSLPIP